MNEYIFSILLIPVLLFHAYVNRPRCRLTFQEKQASLWCADSLYAICGAAGYLFFRNFYATITFTTFHLFLCMFYFALFALFLFAAPSGSRLFALNRERDLSLVPEAEYRFDKIACMLRNFIFALLLVMLPALLFFDGALQVGDDSRLASSLFLICFVLLPPLCIRQALFWSRVIRAEAPV